MNLHKIIKTQREILDYLSIEDVVKLKLTCKAISKILNSRKIKKCIKQIGIKPHQRIKLWKSLLDFNKYYSIN